MALPPLQKNWGLFYFNSRLNFRRPPRCNKSGFQTHGCWHFSCQDTRWMSEYWWTQKMYPGHFPPALCYCWCGGGEKRRDEAPFGSPGSEEPLSIFRIFPVKFRKRYQSHFEALGLHLFVRDAERCSDDCANSSNPTYSRSSHKHAHRTLQSICHFPQPLSLRHQGLWQWRVHGGTLRSWLRKQLQLCQHTLVVWAEATQVVVFCCWRKMRENKKDLTYCRWI